MAWWKQLTASYQSKSPFSQIPLSLGRPLLWKEASSNESFLKKQKHMHGRVDVHFNGKLKKGKDLSLKSFGFTLHVEEDVCGWESQISGITDCDLLRFASVSWEVTEVLLDFTRQASCAFNESFGIFIGIVKPLELDSNHLRQIGNVSAALVHVEDLEDGLRLLERQGGGKDAQNANDGRAFLSGWWKNKGREGP